ncbi:DNA sulfur modification protein DndD [Candidatus Manganitrophus noduliformans]|uniref:DNA sulfur modification protein DndD n=1 Tax=Candidatus Manganitrophus noduliformans TaxID=2606439 RepID=A0A7X6DMZ9_9BACT|nr:DNA sulfur modification protein DndD [Candidatus Manganitrophus noduliformans]NKE70125.1 DNA sulfur modification protein DndD [Candidatus Manganitrophus noduliformans]
MILTSLTLVDFGLFRGRQTVQLAPRPGRPIVLFGGKNGVGKTTLLEAIRLCLYGPGVLGDRVSKETYLQYLKSRIHSNPTLLIQPTVASVTLEFRYADVGVIHAYEVTRSWELRGTQKIIEYLEVKRAGSLLNDVSADHWQDFVRELIPPGVSQLFFFDGEKIQQLADDTSDQQTLADAIKSLFGLDAVERLQTDLGTYLSRIIRPLQGGKQSEEVERLQQEMEDIRNKLAHFRSNRQELETKFSERRSAIARVESKITSEGGLFVRNRNSLTQKKAELKARISQHEGTIRQLCANLLPFALVPKLCTQLKEQLLLEEQAVQSKAASDHLKSLKNHLFSQLDSTGFWKGIPKLPAGAKKAVISKIRDAVKDLVAFKKPQATHLIHQISPAESQRLQLWIDQIGNDISKKAQVISRELEDSYRDFQKVDEALRKIPADDVLKPLLEQLNGLHRELGELGKQTLVLDQEIKSAELKLAEYQRNYNQATEVLAEKASTSSRIQLVPRIHRVLEEYKSGLIQSRVNQLQEEVTTSFNQLCRKKDALRTIAIDPKDFSVTFYDRQNRSLPKVQLSAGEKQIYAISMLWALSKISGRPLPMIIDTPLARLDTDHRKILVNQYFPTASHQVIILSTDTEVDQSYFAQLRKNISMNYRLEFDSVEYCTTIHSGYFWKGTDENH